MPLGDQQASIKYILKGPHAFSQDRQKIDKLR